MDNLDHLPWITVVRNQARLAWAAIAQQGFAAAAKAGMKATMTVRYYSAREDRWYDVETCDLPTLPLAPYVAPLMGQTLSVRLIVDGHEVERATY